jgi:hypothetical protein
MASPYRRAIAKFAKRHGPQRITEESPHWNPRTMGNKRGNSVGYYRKSTRARPD